MKFVISRTELTDILSKAANVVGSRLPTIPILGNFLLEAKEGGLVITATDLTVGVRCFIPAKVFEQGATTLPARSFFSLVKELTAANIEVSVGVNQIAEITAGSSRFRLHGMARNDFPAMPDLSGATQVRLKQKDLKEAFFRTAFAVGKDEERSVLTGLYMSFADGMITMLGTDGKCLVRTLLPLPAGLTAEGEYVLPLKAVDEICKNLSDNADAECIIYLMADKVAVESNQVVVITKLLLGEYPDITRVIPESTEASVALHREELITLLRQMSLFTPVATQSVRFRFDTGQLCLIANSTDLGEGKVSMPINYAGPLFDIAFNPTYFLDILRHSRNETVSFSWTDSFNPGIITDSDEKAPTESSPKPLCVLMPMRLYDE